MRGVLINIARRPTIDSPVCVEDRQRYGVEIDTQVLSEMLLRSGLRPTVKRLAIASMVLSKNAGHPSSKAIHRRLKDVGVKLSLATVYNTVNQFVQAGLLRRISVAADAIRYDSRTSEHCHFYLEDKRILVDAPSSIECRSFPSLPGGYEVVRVDAVIHLRRGKTAAADAHAV